MKDQQSTSPTFRHYFVDEAGDPSLFKKRGKPIVGKEGCSKFFMLGVADIAAPQALADELEELRSQLLVDPYFKGRIAI